MGTEFTIENILSSKFGPRSENNHVQIADRRPDISCQQSCHQVSVFDVLRQQYLNQMSTYFHFKPDLKTPTVNCHQGQFPKQTHVLPSLASIETTEKSKSGTRSKYQRKGRKRNWSRAVFTPTQRKGLESMFKMTKYVNKTQRESLSATLGLSDDQVKVWFQNRRIKWRQRQNADN